MRSTLPGDGKRLKNKTKLIGMKWMRESPTMKMQRKRNYMKLRELKTWKVSFSIG